MRVLSSTNPEGVPMGGQGLNIGVAVNLGWKLARWLLKPHQKS
jgi:hypothetical protein